MNIVIPISTADVAIADVFFRALNLFGPYPCQAYIICSSLTRADAEKYCAMIAPNFRSAQVWEIAAADTGHSWPRNPNAWFGEVAMRINSSKDFKGSWLWCELDSTPMAKNWIEALFTEARVAGKLYWGGGRKLVEHGKLSEYIVGCMIYPKDAWEKTCLRYAVGSSVAWDIYCRYEFLAKGGITHRFHHNWRTTNYKKVGDGMVWDEIDDASNSAPWPSDVLIVHGCKDGSLTKALYFPEEAPRIPDRPTVVEAMSDEGPVTLVYHDKPAAVDPEPEPPAPAQSVEAVATAPKAKKRSLRKKHGFVLTPGSS